MKCTGLFRATRASWLTIMVSAVAVASSMLPSAAFSQSRAAAPAISEPKPVGAGAPIQYHATKTPRKEVAYYSLFWGVDSFTVKAVESGELIRFSYRVVDSERARPLNDKKNEAFLIDPASRAKLVIPSLEKVGQLRQTSTPITGNSYWMAFSNPGRPVKPGDRVIVEIGQFRVEGLVVQ